VLGLGFALAQAQRQRDGPGGLTGEPGGAVAIGGGEGAGGAAVEVERADGVVVHGHRHGQDREEPAPSWRPRRVKASHRVPAGMSSTATVSPVRRQVRQGPSSSRAGGQPRESTHRWAGAG
jgi:hypothetical protein